MNSMSWPEQVLQVLVLLVAVAAAISSDAAGAAAPLAAHSPEQQQLLDPTRWQPLPQRPALPLRPAANGPAGRSLLRVTNPLRRIDLNKGLAARLVRGFSDQLLRCHLQRRPVCAPSLKLKV